MIQNKLSFRDKIKYTVSSLKGIKIETNLKEYIHILRKIKLFDFTSESDKNLKKYFNNIKIKYKAGISLDTLLPEVYALVYEAFSRTLLKNPYDVQIIAGIALHQGKLIQLFTGEGKTFAAVFPAILNAIGGKGVHIMTANDYLARRDALWMQPVYNFFNMQAGYIEEKLSIRERKAAYQADITYCTAKEAGFDYLKDHLKYILNDCVHRDFNFAIIDEADSILIDEARVPLVIAGSFKYSGIDPKKIDKIIPELKNSIHFNSDKSGRRVYFTLEGENKIQKLLGCGGVHEEENHNIYSAITVALHAHHLLVKDVDYIVKNGKIELIDELTGRIADKRKWPYGIQTALEAKEKLQIQKRSRIFSSITIQHFINLYPKLAAMTATAVSGAREFKSFYNLTTVLIPSNRKVIRIDKRDKVYTTNKAKIEAIIRDISTVHTTDRPVLVGTRSVKESETLADLLIKNGIPCKVLNAKNHEQEAALIAKAGMLGAVTISTNMAGRGTDIKLGGEKETEREKIIKLGGLYVIGTNRHESIRIDNQLRGRAGRQGDPGLTCFYISLEDNLFKRYGIQEFIPEKYLNDTKGYLINNPKVQKEIIRAQEIIEEQNYSIRSTIRKYSELVERQRKYLHNIRMIALKEQVLPENIWTKCKEIFFELSAEFNKQKIKEILIYIFLYYLDQMWADHLEYIDILKDGIHLRRFSSREPILEYIHDVSQAFKDEMLNLSKLVMNKFNTVNVIDSGIDLEKEGLEGPSSTWTFLINDDPLPIFNVAMIANKNIGYAAIAALPLILIKPIEAIVSFLCWIKAALRQKHK